MSEAQTNPKGEVDKPQLSMFDVMFGSDEGTNPEQTIEKTKGEVQSESDLVSQLQKETEEPEEEEAVEAAEEDEPEDEVEVEVEDEVVEIETPQVYTVKIDGDEHEVTLDELRNGYQRQADYTRKSQSLAEQRKAYEANLEAVQNERGQYSQALEILSQQQGAELKSFENIDWETLKEDDPMEYMQKRIDFQDTRDRINTVKEEQSRVNQQHQQEVSQIVTEKLQVEAGKLSKELPEYADPSSNLRNEIREYTLGLGFSPEDVDGITDHRVVLVLHKAMLADKGSKASSKKSKTVPKVVKSGTPQTKNQKSRRAKQTVRERLAKTGHQRDAANVFLDLLES
jgi:flagellar basal body rod protein FlgC